MELSTLALTANREHNNAKIWCKVIHETIIDSIDYQTKWQRSFTLDVRKIVVYLFFLYSAFPIIVAVFSKKNVTFPIIMAPANVLKKANF